MRAAALIIALVAFVDVVPAITAKACTVTSPICGVIVLEPTDFIIEVSEPIDPVTVQASDLLINGTSASAFIITNGNTTITFHFNTSPVVAGLNTMYIPAGAFDCGPPVGLHLHVPFQWNTAYAAANKAPPNAKASPDSPAMKPLRQL